MNPENKFDFNQARLKHIGFKARIRSALYGSQTNPEVILSQFECSLGKWIYEHAITQYGHIPEMRELEKVHAQIHVVARELMAQYHNGEVDAARSGLSRIETIANRLAGLIDTIEQKSL